MRRWYQRTVGGRTPPDLPARPGSRRPDDPQDHEQNQRTDEGDQDRARDAAPRDMDVQPPKEKTADEGADDADDDVTDHPVAASCHGRREPPGDQAYDGPDKDCLERHGLTSENQTSHASGERKGSS